MENLFFCAFVVAEPKYVCIFVMLNTTSVCHSRRATARKIFGLFYCPLQLIAAAVSLQFLLYGDKACGV